ncbi:MAG: aldo/keto reductase [Candidatus Acidiferrales bacterium]
MEYARLGSGCLVSRIGFGCALASGYDYGPVDEAAWMETVRASLAAGVNFFDVADVYGFGRAEELLARALGEERHKVALATKCGLAWDSRGRVRRDASRKHLTQALDGSLKRLRVESITLYQLHWPDPATPLEETIGVLRDFRDQGKIQHIGISNVTVEQLQMAHRAAPIDCVQVGYNLLCRSAESELFRWSGANHGSILAHSGLARGLLAGKCRPGSRFEGSDTRARSRYFSCEGQEQKQKLVEGLQRVSKRAGRSVAAVALRWVLDRPEVTSVLAGMRNQAQLEENARAVDWRLAPEDYELLSSLSAACPGSLEGALAKGASRQ